MPLRHHPSPHAPTRQQSAEWPPGAPSYFAFDARPSSAARAPACDGPWPPAQLALHKHPTPAQLRQHSPQRRLTPLPQTRPRPPQAPLFVVGYRPSIRRQEDPESTTEKSSCTTYTTLQTHFHNKRSPRSHNVLAASVAQKHLRPDEPLLINSNTYQRRYPLTLPQNTFASTPNVSPEKNQHPKNRHPTSKSDTEMNEMNDMNDMESATIATVERHQLLKSLLATKQ